MIELIWYWIESHMQADQGSENAFTGHIFTKPEVRSMPINHYLEHLRQTLELDEQHLLYVMIYLDRCILSDKTIITPRSIHGLIASAVCVAQKLLKDASFKLSDWAKAAGVSEKELKNLKEECSWLLRQGEEIDARVDPLKCKQALCEIAPRLKITGDSLIRFEEIALLNQTKVGIKPQITTAEKSLPHGHLFHQRQPVSPTTRISPQLRAGKNSLVILAQTEVHQKTSIVDSSPLAGMM